MTMLVAHLSNAFCAQFNKPHKHCWLTSLCKHGLYFIFITKVAFFVIKVKKDGNHSIKFSEMIVKDVFLVYVSFQRLFIALECSDCLKAVIK